MLKPNSLSQARAKQGSALVVTMILLIVMTIALEAVHSYTTSVSFTTMRYGDYLKENAAAEGAIEIVAGRLMQWVQANGGYTPSISDCSTTGVPGNATFPAITSAISVPSDSKMSDYNYSTPVVYPVLPDDTTTTNTSVPYYLPPLSQRINISQNSPSSPDRYYFTHSSTPIAKSVAARSITYQITMTVTPKVRTLTSPQPLTLVRYIRCDKISPFQWCTYRNGSGNYTSENTYVGPLYVAGNISLSGSSHGPQFTDSVLYGGTLNNSKSVWLGAGIATQLQQTQVLTLIPNLTNTLAVDSNGNRQASFETNTTSPGGGAPAPADEFSTRELIEPPTNPSNDLTPAAIKNARIYNQADARIKVSVSGSTVTTSVVNVDGTTVSAASNSWVTPLLAAITTKVPSTSTFYDRARSTSTPVQVTNIDVGKLGAVMQAYPNVFTTGIIYAWDATGLSSGSRPITGMRLWNAGVLPNGGLTFGTNDPVYLKGDFNTGATLPSGYTINSTPITLPGSNTMGLSGGTTAAQRVVSGYTLQPAGVFGDAITELSNAWLDSNSKNTGTASSTTINLVEGWSTMNANELRSNDTYLDPTGYANPVWIENWSGSRRTMSGEEFVCWHSRYEQGILMVSGWVGDITYDSRASALKLNWGTVTFNRERKSRQ